MQVLLIDVAGTHLKALASGQAQARAFVSAPTMPSRSLEVASG